jgi:hypothetical protein
MTIRLQTQSPSPLFDTSTFKLTNLFHLLLVFSCAYLIVSDFHLDVNKIQKKCFENTTCRRRRPERTLRRREQVSLFESLLRGLLRPGT